MHTEASPCTVRASAAVSALLALFIAVPGLAGCARERGPSGQIREQLDACTLWDTQRLEGSWNGIVIGDGRRSALRRLRALGFGEVVARSRHLRIERSGDLERLDEAAPASTWLVHGDGPGPVVIGFGADGIALRRLEIGPENEAWAAPLRAARDRDALVPLLRDLLDSGRVRVIEAWQRIERAGPTGSEEESLARLDAAEEWETGRQRWWGREAVTLGFQGDVLSRIAVRRAFFLE